MHRLNGTGVTAWIAVVAAIAGLSRWQSGLQECLPPHSAMPRRHKSNSHPTAN